MVSHYPPRPRLTRLDKSRSASSVSRASSSSSESLSPTMTDLVPRSASLKEEDAESSPSPSPSTTTTTSAATPSNVPETLHLHDLELMMYWCTTTYRSMARDNVAEALWQTVIPPIIAALPVPATSPGRKWRYLVSAREHQSHALAGISLDGVQDLTDAQCNATFALCAVLLAFAYAYCLIDDEIGDHDEQPDVLDEFLEVFELTRWLVSAMMMTMDRVAAGELYPLVSPEQTRPTMPDMSQLVVSSLRRQNESESQLDPTHEKEVYDQAIDYLRSALEQLMNGGEPKDFAFCWAFRIPVRYQELVRERKPFALVVLAHYAVILHHLRDSWWMGDWGIRILRLVDACLDPQYRHLISWPIDATGGYFFVEE
ncbi:hypothetical protein N7523_006470 [Penicillium sp. IBT 18751x]|nr:hypothetical protein N7523_006470 [Penicillium sp. IBT 18751x]